MNAVDATRQASTIENSVEVLRCRFATLIDSVIKLRSRLSPVLMVKPKDECVVESAPIGGSCPLDHELICLKQASLECERILDDIHDRLQV
jgi:hypothetical protein